MRLTTWIFGLPLALIAVWIAVANRAPVTVNLDPFSQDNPAISLEMPLYIVLFVAVLIGVLLGGFAIGFRRVARRGAELADTAPTQVATLFPQHLRKSRSPPQ